MVTDYGYQPRWKRQLDGSANASVNCNVIATGVAIDMETAGKLHPPPSTIRARMHAPSGATNLWDTERAIESYDTKAELPDPYLRLHARRETDGDEDAQWQDVLDWLPDGKDRNKLRRSIVMGVDYGKLRRLAPHKTGSDSFDGFHSITLTAVRIKRRRSGPVQQVRMYDSLNDGRSPVAQPRGPVWVDGWKVRDAGFAYGREVHGKDNRIAACFCKPGDREAGPEPPPDPTEELERELTEAYAAIREAIDDLSDLAETTTDPVTVDAISDLIDELREALPGGLTGAADAVVESGMAPGYIDRGV